MNNWEEIVNELSLGPVSGPKLFKRASLGAIQEWRIEIDGGRYRTVHGQYGGALIISKWTDCYPKNVGKKNETTSEQQCNLEVEALYKKKREQDFYFDDISKIDDFVYVEPMLANKFDAKKVEWPVISQPKLDGMRCITTRHGCFSRKGKRIIAAAHIEEGLKNFFEEYPEAILDGEIYNHEFKDNFQELMSIAKKQKLTSEDKEKAEKYLNYHVYDIPSYKAEYYKRIDWFSGNFATSNTPDDEKDGKFGWPTLYKNVYFVDFWSSVRSEEQLAGQMEIVLEEGYEGLIVRQTNNHYEHKRTNQLMKYKNFIDEEFEIADLEEGKGNWSDAAKRAILWKPGADKSLGIIRGRTNEAENTCFAAGIAGTKNYATRLLRGKSRYIGKPATVTYFRLTADGIPYLPVMKIVRDYE